MKTKTSRKLGIALAGVLALFVLAARVHATPPQYTVTILATLGGNAPVTASYGINGSGQVVGLSETTGGESHAVVWTGTTPTDLGTLPGGGNSAAHGINASGQVAGTSDNGVVSERAVRWTGTTTQDLGTLGGAGSGGAGINASGQVAGFADTSSGQTHAVRWTGTTPTDLGTLPGGTLSQGNSINDLGQVAGYSNGTGLADDAVRWTGTTAQDLGTLPGGTMSAGWSINASGQVAGWSNSPTGSRAVVWTDTTPTDLGSLGGTGGIATGINDSGDVTGIAWTAGNAALDAFLYTGGKMYDLSSLLVPGSGVTGLTMGEDGNNINDADQIAATGTIGGTQYALLLTPVATPEPTATVSLLLGLGVIAARRNRQARF